MTALAMELALWCGWDVPESTLLDPDPCPTLCPPLAILASQYLQVETDTLPSHRFQGMAHPPPGLFLPQEHQPTAS